MTSKPLTKAVIMARGLGTRMRKADEAAALSQDQLQAAAAGVKALIPVGRPFLDYVLSGLADAGFESVCLVIGPEHDQLREYYTRTAKPTRLAVDFAIQEKPLGTADAIAAAETYAGQDPFFALNSDNYYPASALRLARELTGMGLVAFEEEGLLSGSNIPADRVKGFAVIQMDAAGCLAQILEKPSAEQLAALPKPRLISMNCWRLGPEIFTACRSISRSPRGEFELTDAVRWCCEKMKCCFQVARVQAPVLDLSYQSDITPVARMLSCQEVSL